MVKKNEILHALELVQFFLHDVARVGAVLSLRFYLTTNFGVGPGSTAARHRNKSQRRRNIYCPDLLGVRYTTN